MAISNGVAKHFAFANIGGISFPIKGGSVDQSATKKSSSFHIQIPMYHPGAYELLSGGQPSCVITVESVAGSGTLIQGVVDEVTFDYPHPNGGGNIQVSGRDQSAFLHQKKSMETFINRTTTSIVQDLGGRVGLAVSVIGGGGILAGKFVDQQWRKITDGVSYAAVIHKCAEIDNANWFVDPLGGTLNYVVGNFTTIGSYNVNYHYQKGVPISGDYLRLSVSRNMEADSNIQVTVESWMPKQKQKCKGVSNCGAGAPSNGQLEYKYHIPNLTQDHCKAYAKARCDEAARHALTIRTELIGDPKIRPDMALVLNGTGAYDQSYQIDNISHRFGMSGYTMTVTAKTPGQGRSAS